MENLGMAIAVAAMILVAVAIVVLNDRTKEAASRHAIEKGRIPRKRWENYRTSWSHVLTYCVAAALIVLFTIVAPGQLASRKARLLLAFSAVCVAGLIGSVWETTKRNR